MEWVIGILLVAVLAFNTWRFWSKRQYERGDEVEALPPLQPEFGPPDGAGTSPTGNER